MNTYQEIQKLVEQAVYSLSTAYKGSSLTDVFILVDEDSAELAIFDDENNNLVKGIISGWGNCENINYKEELQKVISDMNKNESFKSLDVYTPFSINYADEDFIVIKELLLINDESIIKLEDDFLKRMDKEFDEFLDKLLKE